MNDIDLEAKQLEQKVSDLAAAMERVRNDQASRDDVVVELKQASRARLEMLAQDLQPVFKEVPDDNDQFEFALTDGENARLWIDMTSFVRMGRDRRQYEFVKDTRMGRTLLAQNSDRSKMAKIVTNYVAERILERERIVEGEWVALRNYDFSDADSGETHVETAEAASKSSWQILGGFLLGCAMGALAIILWAWYGDIPAFLLK